MKVPLKGLIWIASFLKKVKDASFLEQPMPQLGVLFSNHFLLQIEFFLVLVTLFQMLLILVLQLQSY